MSFTRFTNKNIVVNTVLVIGYLLWNSLVGELKLEHYYLSIIWLSAFYASEMSRKIILGFSIFILFWIIYDSMRIIPNYEVTTPHIQEPYDIEKILFGINTNGQLLTPNEYFALYNNKFLDFLSGFFYINWIPVPIGFGIYLFIKDKYLFVTYSLAFLFVNLLGFIIYYLYPAAPPWYVDVYGFDLQINVPGNRAGLARFDQLIGFPIFEEIYNKNANVLAAMPSLHSSYPVIVLYFSEKKGMKLFAKTLFTLFLFGIWFAAIYSSHHYIIDVIAGVSLAIASLLIFNQLIKTPVVNRKIITFIRQIE